MATMTASRQPHHVIQIWQTHITTEDLVTTVRFHRWPHQVTKPSNHNRRLWRLKLHSSLQQSFTSSATSK